MNLAYAILLLVINLTAYSTVENVTFSNHTSAIVISPNYKTCQLVITSPEDQQVNVVFYSLADDVLLSTKYRVHKGRNVIDISKLAFMKNHIYFEVAMKSKYRLDSYRLIRK